MDDRPPSPLPKIWFFYSRTFWLGWLATGFLVWLTVDSFLYLTAYRTIHRGSWRDWSEESVIPATPDETGSFVAKIYGGCFFVSWSDHLNENADYYGTDERVRLTPDDDFYWSPRMFWGADSMARRFGARLPTWLLLLTWLGLWAWFLRKSHKRQLCYTISDRAPATGNDS